jgi:hypothetical protein
MALPYGNIFGEFPTAVQLRVADGRYMLFCVLFQASEA